MNMVAKLSELVQLKGIDALRLNQLYDGSSKEDLKIPPIEMFTKNNYKDYKIADMSTIQLQKICCFNVFDVTPENESTTCDALYAFYSFFNHKTGSDHLLAANMTQGICTGMAIRDIEQGEELLIDYARLEPD
jgi:hypothetical protein